MSTETKTNSLSKFVLRNSLLDEQYEDSIIRCSPFVGLYHLSIILQVMYFVSIVVV